MISHLEIGANGRFGNQMFQLAALLGVSARTGYEFRLPLENTAEGFDSFRNPLTGAIEPGCMELRKAFALPEKWFAPRKEFIRDLHRRYQEPHYHFDPYAFEVADGTDFWGYFQSESYFAHAAAAVRSAFTFRAEIREKARVTLEQIATGLPRVAIHVRRGDYLVVPERFPVLGMDYYRKSLSTWFSDSPRQVLVFSDDPRWCAEAFPEYHAVHTGNSCLDMCLMSQCDHFIIANSSFSWWGAWLNPSPDKVVVAPARWFGPALEQNGTADLLPKEWHRA